MNTLTRNRGFAWFAAALTMTAGPATRAEPVAMHVLDTLEVVDAQDCTIATLRFLLPMQYMQHFPAEFGDEFLIRIEPLEAGWRDDDALTRREAVRPDPSAASMLTIATYEGDQSDGPFLRIQLEYPVRYSVTQGADYRSLVITMADGAPEDGAPVCDTPQQSE